MINYVRAVDTLLPDCRHIISPNPGFFFWGVAKLLWQERDRIRVWGGIHYPSSIASGELFKGGGDASHFLLAGFFAS